MSNAPTKTKEYRQGLSNSGSSLLDCWIYLRSFFRSTQDVASLVPSSRWTAKAMLQGISFDSGQTIVELGAGTGAVTALLLQATKGRGRTLIVERDPDFYKRLKDRFPEAEILAADAVELQPLLTAHGIQKIDHVISTLPINWLTSEDQNRLLECVCRNLDPEGTFRQLTHVPWFNQELFQRHFASVECPIVFRNLPPAGCYICRHPRTAQTER